jgi:RimJ/RimL family protein N-acetyltransferase
VIKEGIHDPERMPFDDPPWTDEASPDRELAWITRQWAGRSAIKPDAWRLRFAVLDLNGLALGMQDLLATAFPALRSVSSYSWLGSQHQGRGLGKEMRAAVLHLAFDALGAERAESAAFDDNLASAGVSAALGYEPNGYEWALRRGRPDRLTRFILHRQGWLDRRRGDIQISGADRCTPLLGLSP